MKLSKVVIDNYRGFYGKNTIKFDTSKKNKNINLVIARNDTGKTTFLNAIYWCLYGEEQFRSSKKSSNKIVSNRKIMETSIDGRLNISVSLVFDDEKGPKYEITRKRVFKRIKSNDADFNVSQQGSDDFYGTEMNSTRTGFENIEHIENFIVNTIPKGISSFFLLDGEQLKVIFTTDINYKIREAIERVANIESIKGVIDNLTTLDKKYSSIKSGTNSNYGALQANIDQADGMIEKYNGKLKDITKNNETLNKQIMDLSEFLQSHNEAIVREQSHREERIKKENERINEYIKEEEGQLDNLTMQTYILKNSKKAIEFTIKKFEEIIEGGDFPPAFDPAHVLQLLRRKECICGTKIQKNSDAEKRLEKLSNAKSYKEYTRIISEGASRLPELTESIKSKIETLVELRKKIKSNESKLQKNLQDLEEIKNAYKDSDIKEISEKGEEKEMLEREIFKNERERGNIENNLKAVEEAKKEDVIAMTQIQIKDMKNQLVTKKSEKCKELVHYAKEIKEAIMKKIKNNIEKTTAKNFIELHWKAENYEKVGISDDFSLSIRDKYKGEIIDELSQGAALCFGLAFMTALRNYSGYDVPIIIDSPVGKIDEGNREKIAKNLPKQLEGKQVIFLVTSSEYTSVFKECLKDKISTEINLSYNKNSAEIDISNERN